MRGEERVCGHSVFAVLIVATAAPAQMIANTQAINNYNPGINKSLPEETGTGRGNLLTSNSI